jgi:hypothetical protein
VDESEQESIEKNWDTVKSIHTTIDEEKLGFRRKAQERWISDTKRKLIDERNGLKQTLLSSAKERAQTDSQLLNKENDEEI